MRRLAASGWLLALVALVAAAGWADELPAPDPAAALGALAPASPAPRAPALGLLAAHGDRLLGWHPDWRWPDDLEVDGEPLHEDGDAAALAEALDHAATAWIGDHVRTATGLASLVQDRLRRVHLDVEVVTPDGRVENARLVVLSGRPTTWYRVAGAPVLLDYEVEIACDNSGGSRPSALGDPVPLVVRGGVALRLLATATGDGDLVRLDAALEAGDVERTPALATGARFLGAVTLPRYRGATIRASALLAPDAVLDTGLATPEGAWRLRVRARAVAPKGAQPGGRPLRWLSAGALLAPRPRMDLPPPGTSELDEASWPQAVALRRDLDPRTLRTALRDVAEGADVELDGAGGVWVAGDAERVARVVEAVDDLLVGDGALRFRMDLRADGEPVGTATLAARDGESALVRVGTDHAYLLDADVEVG